MTKKQKVVFAVVAALIVLGIILSYVCYHFIYGTRITSREGEAYHKLEGKGVYSPSIVLLPETEKILEQMGLQIKYARLRRKLPSELVAERAGISRATLVSIEKGSPSVAMGCYAAVLHALNYMDKDLLLVAKDDELGRKLQDLDLPVRKRAPRKE